MKDEKEFPKVVKWLYLASLPWYYLCSVVTYYAYGNMMDGNPIKNWPQGLWITRLASFFSLFGAIVISITTNQATLMAIQRLEAPLRGKKGVRAAKFAFVTCQLLVALALRRTPLQFIQGFMGSFGVGCLTFVFPFALHLKLRKFAAHNAVFFSLGCTLMAVGMLSSLYYLVINAEL